jgi:hypothetical protein
VLDPAEVVRQAGGVGAASEPRGAQDPERPAIERWRLGVTPLVLPQHAEIIQRAGDVEIPRPERPLGQTQRSPTLNVGGGIATEHPVHIAERSRDLDPQSTRVFVGGPCVRLQEIVGAAVTA